RLTLWFTANYLQVNATKTQAMTLGKSQYPYDLFIAYVLPHLEYCCPLLLGITKAQFRPLKNNIESTNYYAIKTLLNLGNSATYDF
ncbi:unnamed protein product, partial [Porites lobata]